MVMVLAGISIVIALVPRHATPPRVVTTRLYPVFFFFLFFIYLISLFHLLLHSICHVSAICTLSCFLCVFLSLLFSCSYGFRFLWCLISGVKLLIHRDFTTNVVVLPFMLFSLCASGSTCQLFSPPFCAIFPKYIKACEDLFANPSGGYLSFFQCSGNSPRSFYVIVLPIFPIFTRDIRSRL